MNIILNKPYIPIWLTIPLIMGLSVVGINSAIDIQLHDTYFVIASFHMGIMFSIILGLVGFLYWLKGNIKLVNWMTAFHVITTLLTLTLVVITSLLFNKALGSDIVTFITVNQIMFIIIFIMVLSQLIFLVNLIIGLIRNEK